MPRLFIHPAQRPAFLLWAALALHGFPATAQQTRRVGLATGGGEAVDGTGGTTSVSADGRYVMFESASPDLVPGDTNAQNDGFVRDVVLGTTERVTLGSNGNESAQFSGALAMSANGRYVLFKSFDPDLTPDDTNAGWDGFVRDRVLGTTELVTLDSSGACIPSGGQVTAMSSDGRFVVFDSGWTTIVPGDTNGFADVYVRDRLLGTTELVSLGSTGAQGNQISGSSDSISTDGNFVLFRSLASNLVPGDTNGVGDLFVRDRANGVTERINVATSGLQSNVTDFLLLGELSDDGRIVVFDSMSNTLVPGDTNNVFDVFMRDRQLGTTTRLSVSPTGVQGNSVSHTPTLTRDGRFAFFRSAASNLVPGVTNSTGGPFLRDLQLGTIELVSHGTDGALGNGATRSIGTTFYPDARVVAFVSDATNFDPADTNGRADVFLRDRRPAFASVCGGDGPGSDHTSVCPCGNSGAPARGCGHSFDPNGALLDASGFPLFDDVVLHSHGTPSTAFTLFLQHAAAGDTVFHDGVLCASGALVRLRGRAAVAGEASFPNSAFANDTTLTLSQRGGGLWNSGARRYYSAWYRNTSSTFCPPATANVTNGIRIDW